MKYDVWKNKHKVFLAALFCIGLIFFMQGLGVHGIEYRDDEIFYYQSTQEMVQENNFLSPTYFGANRFQKPILFYWFVILSYKIFGFSWFAARLVSAVFASLTICVTWLLAKEFFNRKVASLSCLILSTTPLFFRHAKNVVPDMALTFFIVLAVYCAVKFLTNPHPQYRILFFVSCGLGFMVKGFTAVIFPLLILILFAITTNKKDALAKINFPLGLIIMVVIILPWFLFMIKVHGQEYLNYMLKVETQNRLVAPNLDKNLFVFFATFLKNALFYLQTIISYFAPWSLFAVMAIPYCVYRFVKNQKEGQIGGGENPEIKTKETKSLLFFLMWFFTVYLFFSFILFRMSHYLLALTTPFAILLSFFFVQVFSDYSYLQRTLNFLRRFLIHIMMFLSFVGFGFLYIFLVKVNTLWIIPLFLIYLVCVVVVQRRRNPVVAPCVLGLILFCGYLQSNLISSVGGAAHSTLQEFAKTINNDKGQFVVGVGSNDIHEKEFQVYFDQSIEKAATRSGPETKQKLQNLFSMDKKVYCLLTQKDFDSYLKDYTVKPLDVIQVDYMFRKRLYLDKNFFLSVLTLDQDQVHSYLMEEVILVKKEKDA